MQIIKPIGIFVRNKQYLVARDKGEDFFKNVGGRVRGEESEMACLKRCVLDDVGCEIKEEPKLIFDLPPTPAVGDPGDEVVLRGYLIECDTNFSFLLSGETEEIAWVDSKNANDYNLTPQIRDLIVPRLADLGLVD